MVFLPAPILLGALLFAVFGHHVGAQQPTLSLFMTGGREETFFVPVGSGEMYMLNFVTNVDAASRVTGNIESITVTLNGGSGASEVERIEADASPGTSITVQAVDDVYEFRLLATGSNNVTTEDYQNLLASLRYISTLPNTTLQDPPRNITVVANGPTESSESSTALLVLLISNQASPIIEQRITTSVSENAANGEIFAQLTATDPDGLDVTFTFQSVSTIFELTLGGVLSVLDTNGLDYEDPSQRRFELTIVATDTDPISPMSSEATLIIVVDNANDNAPSFTSTSYTFSVNEEVANVEVGTLSATDDDQEPRTNTLGTVFFDFLNPSNVILQNFDINRGTGVITVREPGLDFESVQVYNFDVEVSDGIFSDTATIEVQVEDIPDNRPVITPAEKNILIDLDTNQREVLLTEGSGGPLVVSDSDSPFLQDGVARITVVRGATVRYSESLMG